MKYAICYDIVSNKRRRGISRILEGYGYRVQKSVFETFLSRQDIKELEARLRKAINAKVDQIRIFPLCANCDSTMKVLGNGEKIERQSFLVL